MKHKLTAPDKISLIKKYRDDPEFLEWLEKRWNDDFCQYDTIQVASILYGEPDMAVLEYEKDKGID